MVKATLRRYLFVTGESIIDVHSNKVFVTDYFQGTDTDEEPTRACALLGGFGSVHGASWGVLFYQVIFFHFFECG